MSAPRLDLNGLSPISDASDTPTSASPARGRETRTALLQKLRPPPLVHAWDFWHEKPQGSNPAPNPATTTNVAATTTSAAISTHEPTPTASYDPRLSLLHSVTDVRTFWTLFNNFSFTALPPRTSVHLFHKSILPLWEHPRNTHGGAWTFRQPHASASAFFRALALLAIGEQLQEAVTVDPKKLTFRDDICGISFVVKSERVTAVQVWNRDAGNDEGVRRVLECVLAGVPAECRPRDGQYYYKRHKDHVGFSPSTGDASSGKELPSPEEGNEVGKGDAEGAEGKADDALRSVQAVEQEYEKVRKILEEVKVSDGGTRQELATDSTPHEANTAD